MLILKTSKETLPRVVEYSKHALAARPQFEPGEIVLIAQTRDDLAIEEMPIRYRMEIRDVFEDRDGLSQRIWGHHWKYVVEGYNCCPLKYPFDIVNIQVTQKNYQQGGTVFHVDPRDLKAIVDRGYLELSL